jgi:hypothetical protein
MGSLVSQRLMRLVAISMLVCAAGTAGQARDREAPPPSKPDTAAVRARVAADYGRLPLVFEANAGQTDSRVRFLSRGPGYALFLTADEAVLKLNAAGAVKGQADVIRMRLAGAQPPASIAGEDVQRGTVNRFIGADAGRWRAGISTYGKVRYTSVYPGVDAVYYGNQQHLEYDFELDAGIDPAVIRLRFDGARDLRIDGHGDLVLRAAGGEIRQPKPFVYQVVSGAKREVDGRYVMKGKRQVGFAIGAHDRTLPLVIDPTLSYSTYLGGSGPSGYPDRTFGGIAVDAAGNVIVTGGSYSTDFPTTAGAMDSTMGGIGDAFVTKLNAAGTGLIFSTFLGGGGGEDGYDLTVDAAGNVYVYGNTDSNDFPTTPGALQTAKTASNAAFITKLNPAGNAILFSTYFGGNSDDYGQGRIAVDAGGNVYFCGIAQSSNLPTTAGVFQSTFGGGFYDSFAGKLNNTGTALIYLTYLGGNGMDWPQGLGIDAAGHAYITGFTDSPNFQTTPGAFQPAYGGDIDVFVTKLNGTGGVLFSTFLGGNSPDFPNRLIVDAAGNAIIGGFTGSTDYPTTAGAFRTAAIGGPDAFVTKLNAAGSNLVFSTFVGGTDYDAIQALALDAAGTIFATGLTMSTDFPVTADALQIAHAGNGGFCCDTFVVALAGDGSALKYSSYLGSPDGDVGSGIAVDSSGGVYVSGNTDSTAFPTTPGTFQPAKSGGDDLFVAKFSFVPPVPASASAGADQTAIGCAACLSLVTLDASASSDPQGRSMTFVWSGGATVLASTADPVRTAIVGLPVGVHAITLTVGNGTGLTASDTVVITVHDSVAAANATIASRDATITAQAATITALQGQIAALQAQIASLGTSLQQAFSDPAFIIPGTTPQQQLTNLVTAIGNLNHGQKQALYKNLGGKK